MARKTCREPRCENPPRGGGGFSGKFCSDACEVRYEHIRSDARDAQRAAEREVEDDFESSPGYDG